MSESPANHMEVDQTPVAGGRAGVASTLAIACIAIAFTLSIFDNGPGTDLALLAWVSLLLLSAVACRSFAPMSMRLGTFEWVLLAYLGWLVINVLASTLQENSLYTAFALGTIVLVLLAGDQFRRLLPLLLIAGLVSACWGIAEYLYTSRRANGPIYDPNVWAALHNIFFFTVLGSYSRGGSWRRRVALALIMLPFALAVACSYSRVGSAVFAVALVFSLAVMAVRTRRLVDVAIIGLIAAAAFGFVHSYASQSEASHSEGYTTDLDATGWQKRLAQWQAAIAIAREYPITGSGLGTFKVHYARHRTSADLDTAGNYVHNDYLQLLAEAGPPAFVAAVGLVLYLAYLLFRTVAGTAVHARTGADDVEQTVLIVAAGTALVHATMNFALFQLPVQILLGVLFAHIVTNVGTGEEAGTTLSSRWMRPLTVGIAVIAPLPLFADAMTANLLLRQTGMPFAAFVREDQRRLFDAVTVLARVRSDHSTNHFGLATFYRMTGDRIRGQGGDPQGVHSLAVASAIEYERGLAINPYRYSLRVFYSQLLREHPGLADIDELRESPASVLVDGIALTPIYVDLYVALAEIEAGRGEHDAAYATLSRALLWMDVREEGYVDTRLELIRLTLRHARRLNDVEMQRRLLAVLESQ